MGHKFKSLGKLSNGWTDLHQTWHTCTDSSENGYTPNKLPLETQGWYLGVLGGQTFKSLGKLSNGWTDWHQLWYTSADSSGNGHRLITSCPSISQGAFRGGGGGVGFRGHKFKSLGKLSNGWTDLHQTWHTCADSSENGIRPTNCPSRHNGGTWGVLGGQTLKSLGKLSNGWTDWHQLWFTSANSSGNGHRLNTSRPSITQGAFRVVLGGHKFKRLGKLSNGWTDSHQIWYTPAYSSGNGHRLNTIRPSIPQGEFRGVLWGHKFKSGKAAKRLDRICTRLWIYLGMDIG